MNSPEHKLSEFTILILKPNAVRLGLTGVVRQELFEQKFDVIANEPVIINRRQAHQMYDGLGDRKQDVVDHVVSGPSYGFAIFGQDVIRGVRELVGCTAWQDRPAKGLRGRYAQDHIRNSVHAPDSHKESAMEYLQLFPDITDKILKGQLADEFRQFLNNRQAIEFGERFVNQYSV